jgi:hypothetical protein
MKQANTTGAMGCCRLSSLFMGLLACVVAMAALVFGISHLSSDLLATFAGEDESISAAVAASDQALPADAPSISLVRSQDLQAQSSKAASDNQKSVVLLDDWTYTQATFSPFFFAPNGFDFFNPLFAFDFFPFITTNGQTTTNPFLTPFGFTISPTTGFPIVTTGTGGTTIIATNGTGTTTTSSFLNGASVFVSVTAATFVFPLGLGTQGFSQRHAFTPIIVVINITVIVNVNVSPSK